SRRYCFLWARPETCGERVTEPIIDGTNPAAGEQFPVGGQPDLERRWTQVAQKLPHVRRPAHQALLRKTDAQSRPEQLPAGGLAIGAHDEIVAPERKAQLSCCHDDQVRAIEADEVVAGQLVDRQRGAATLEIAVVRAADDRGG